MRRLRGHAPGLLWRRDATPEPPVRSTREHRSNLGGWASTPVRSTSSDLRKPPLRRIRCWTQRANARFHGAAAGHSAPRPSAARSRRVPVYSVFLLERIIVASIIATCTSTTAFVARTSPAQTLTARPGLTTRPRATNRVPRAGARKLTLYSTVRTSHAARSPDLEVRTPPWPVPLPQHRDACWITCCAHGSRTVDHVREVLMAQEIVDLGAGPNVRPQNTGLTCDDAARVGTGSRRGRPGWPRRSAGLRTPQQRRGRALRREGQDEPLASWRHGRGRRRTGCAGSASGPPAPGDRNPCQGRTPQAPGAGSRGFGRLAWSPSRNRRNGRTWKRDSPVRPSSAAPPARRRRNWHTS
jgi:hypothetical protein